MVGQETRGDATKDGGGVQDWEDVKAEITLVVKIGSEEALQIKEWKVQPHKTEKKPKSKHQERGFFQSTRIEKWTALPGRW